MASVCGSSLSLMDAGVPLKAAVAGIMMGLTKKIKSAILTIFRMKTLGDMISKWLVQQMVPALQMDLKIDSITKLIMEKH